MHHTDKKYYSSHITKRFLFAMDHITGSKTTGKVTAKLFGDIVGISSSNLNRIRNNPAEHAVTIEAIGRLCHHYKISPYWLITGQGDMYNNDELKTAYKTLESRFADLEKAFVDIEKSLSIIRKNKTKTEAHKR